MQRQIKFKAWDLNAKKFIEEEFLMTSVYKNVITVAGVSYNRHEEDDPYENVVFCQFTGLKDKNGLDIYEKDILKSYYGGDLFVVEFYAGEFGCHKDMKVLGKYLWDKCEIVGNLFEHTHLLIEEHEQRTKI